MPIFHEPSDSLRASPDMPQPLTTSLQGARTTDSGSHAGWDHSLHAQGPAACGPSLDADPESPSQMRKSSMFGRKEWMERIKRTNSPSWRPWQGVSIQNPRADCRYNPPLQQRADLFPRVTSRATTTLPSVQPTMTPQGLPLLLLPSCNPHRPLPPNIYETMPQPAWRLSDPDRHCTLEILEKRE